MTIKHSNDHETERLSRLNQDRQIQSHKAHDLALNFLTYFVETQDTTFTKEEYFSLYKEFYLHFLKDLI